MDADSPAWGVNIAGRMTPGQSVRRLIRTFRDSPARRGCSQNRPCRTPFAQGRVEAPISRAPAVDEAAFSGAIETISEPDFELNDSDWEIRLLGWQRTSEWGLATPGALRADPTTVLSSGRYLGLAVLPFVISTPVRDFYPAKRDGTRTLDISVSEIAETVISRLGLGRTSFVTFDPSLKSVPHEACRSENVRFGASSASPFSSSC